MKHRVKVTVLDTLLYEDLQREYCQNPCSGNAPSTTKAMFLSFTVKTVKIVFGSAV